MSRIRPRRFCPLSIFLYRGTGSCYNLSKKFNCRFCERRSKNPETVAAQRLWRCIFFVNERHCRQNLRLTIVICGIALNSRFRIGYNYILQISMSRFKEIGSLLNLLLFIFSESEAIMKLPYGYVLAGEEIVIHKEKADAVRNIFEYYLAGASLGKIVDMLFVKGIPSPTGNSKWTRAAVDKLLANAKYIPIIGMETYMDVQFERNLRCNVNYDKAGHPRKAARYRSPSIEVK